MLGLVLVSLGVVIFPVVSSAKTASEENLQGASESILSEALNAFNSKDYVTAKDLYLMLDETNPSYTSSYNLAVCFYRIGDWKQARQRFLLLHDEDYLDEHVHLNLAIAETKLGMYKSALDHFSILSTTASSDSIAMIAYKNYQKISKKLSVQDEKVKIVSDRWLLSASLGLGYDDGVVSFVDETTLAGDNYTEFSGSALWFSSADYENNWLVDAALYSAKYFDASDYNVDVISAGFKKHLGLNKTHRLDFGSRVDQSSVGGTGYLRSFYVHAADRIKLGKTARLKILARIQQATAIDEQYQSLAGSSVRAYARLNHKVDGHRFNLRYQFDDESKNDSASSIMINFSEELVDGELVDVFTSYSTVRHGFYGAWSYNHKDWRLQLDANYRISTYKDPHVFYVEGERISELRSDNRLSFGASLSRELGQHWEIEAELNKTINESNITKYDYDQMVVSGILTWKN